MTGSSRRRGRAAHSADRLLRLCRDLEQVAAGVVKDGGGDGTHVQGLLGEADAEVAQAIRVKRPGGGHPRARPDHRGGDKAYSSRRYRRYLCRRQIKHTIPEPKDQRANLQRRDSRGGRPAGFDKEMYKRLNEVARTINRLKHARAVATRYDKPAYVFHGTVTVASIRLGLKP